MRKKAVVSALVSILVGVAIGHTGTMYFTQWREPKAKYIETDNPRLIQIRKNLDELKAELKAKGLYNCCIRNDCNWCALQMGHCPCAELVAKEGVEKSCPECAAAWNRKQGKIPGVDPDAVQVTTFGIYGVEKGGHHHPESGEQLEEPEPMRHQEEGHHPEKEEHHEEHSH